MNDFQVLDTKFYNELRNGSAFGSNLTDYTNELVGNVGETVQLIRTVSVYTNVLASDFGSFNYVVGGTYGTFTFGGNWFLEGLSVGATVNISWDGNTVSETIFSVTGSNGNVLNVTKTNLDLAGLVDSDRSDFEIVVTSVPDRVNYKYGLNQLSANNNNYQSPFDSNEQSYYHNSLTGAFQTLNPITSNGISWDLGTVEMRFTPSGSYAHQFEIKHTFKIPYYLDGQLSNIDDVLAPSNLIGTNTFKYGYGLFLAETNNNYNRVLEDAGLSGSVGYYNENFNGFNNDYSIENLVISNSYSSQTLEGTDTNTVTFQVKNNAGNFVTGQQIIFKHSKLPTGSEYENKSDSFDDIWMVDSLETEVGFVGINSSIITGCSVTLNADNSLLDVGFTVTYSANQQLIIEDTKSWLMSLLIDDNTIAPDIANRVNLKIDSNLWSFDNDIQGLVQNNDIRFYTSNQNIVKPTSSEFTNFTGWDADFMGCYFSFETKAEEFATVKSCIFRLIAYKNDVEQFELANTPINVGAVITTSTGITTYPYQLVNVDYQNSYNITPNEDFNRIILNSEVPTYGNTWQLWNGQLSFEVKWREWIANLSVDNIFYNSAQPNNNLNEKTSNYSGLNGYDIYGVIDLTIGVDTSGVLKGGLAQPDTIYRIESDISSELDFDVSGSNPFTATTYIYDINNNLTDNIYNNQDVRIEIEFDHTLGVLPKLQGEIFIEKVGQVSNIWRLSTQKDWSNPLNPLSPSDTLASGNTTVVEIVSISNKVTLICNTNNLNLDPNIEYNVYGRLFNT